MIHTLLPSLLTINLLEVLKLSMGSLILLLCICYLWLFNHNRAMKKQIKRVAQAKQLSPHYCSQHKLKRGLKFIKENPLTDGS